ncbi:MAG TPA: PQQ-binding-like beta-propeller repeat protein, partial [Candidatus Dormibacteraeota bacterium]|nr:PQQ-binding-like beta-propeller repeat protein [Candidatus Dormibacteraeota bacterium]
MHRRAAKHGSRARRAAAVAALGLLLLDAGLGAPLAALGAELQGPAAALAPVVRTMSGPAPAAAASAVDWPMYLQNGALTGASPETILTASAAPNLRPAWKFATGGVIAASATVAGGRVYVGSWDGYEYAIDAATGSQVWRTFLGVTTGQAGCYPQNLGVSSTAAVVNGVVYVGGGDSNWYALDAATGTVLWSVPTGDNSATGGHYNWSSP